MFPTISLKNLSIVFFFLFCFFFQSDSVFAVTKTWTGTTSPTWSTASNWNPTGAPAAGDDAVIPSVGVTNEPTLDVDVSVSTLNLAVGRTLTIGAARQITISNTATLNGTVTGGGTMRLINGADIVINATMTMNLNIGTAGVTQLTGTNGFLNGNLITDTGAGFQVNGEFTVGGDIINNTTIGTAAGGMAFSFAGTNFTNNGAVTRNIVFNGVGVQNIIGSGSWGSAGSSITFGGTTITTLSNDVTFGSNSNIFINNGATVNPNGKVFSISSSFFTNNGTMSASGVVRMINSADILNNGTIASEFQTVAGSGTIQIQGTGIITGNVSADDLQLNDAQINISGNITAVSAIATVSGVNEINFSGQIFANNSSVACRVAFSRNGAQTITGTGLWTGNVRIVNNSTTTLANDVTFSGNSLTIDFNSIFNLNGNTFTKSSGSYNDSAGGTTNGPGLFRIEGGVTLTGGTTGLLNAPVEVTSGTNIADSSVFGSTMTVTGGRIRIGQTVTINGNITNNAIIENSTANPTLIFKGSTLTNNTSTFIITNLHFGGTTQLITGTTSIGSPNISVLSGSTTTLGSSQNWQNLIINGTLDHGAGFNLAAGPITINNGGVLRNFGTGDLTLENTLTNNAGGTVNFNGNGGQCGDTDDILIRSDSTTQRSWNGAGTFSMQDVDVSRQGGSSPITVQSGTDSSNNGINWTFVGCTTVAVKLQSFDAVSNGEKVQLRWVSGYEIENIGYNIYREIGGKKKLITPAPVAGSALQIGAKEAMTAGSSYIWFDTLPKKHSIENVSYWLEDVDIYGKATLYGPITPLRGEVNSFASRSKLLSEIGNGNNNFVQKEFPTLLQSHNRSMAQSLSQQWFLAGLNAVKIAVNQKGWTRVSYEEILANGLNQNADLSNLKLYLDGVEQAIKVNTDGSIEFYAEGQDARYTDSRTYWLVATQGTGKRVESLSAGAFDPNVSTSGFMSTVLRQDRAIRVAVLRNGNDTDNFFASIITRFNSPSQSLQLTNIDRNSSAQPMLEIGLQGWLDQSHDVKVLLNGVEVGIVSFNGSTHKVAQFNVSQINLREGENIVRFVKNGRSWDTIYLDYVRLSYPKQYRAVDNRLEFNVISGQSVRVNGFTSVNAKVFDITDSFNVKELQVEMQNTQDGYAFTLQPTTSNRVLIAMAQTPNQALSINRNQPSNLNANTNSADFVIITHRDFRQAIEPLRLLRQSQGLNVSVVDVEDIYDEWNFGSPDSQSVKDFLSHANTVWQTRPRYLMLVGDTTYDPRNYLGEGVQNFVPSSLIESTYTETASDDDLVDFNNDGLADMAIGRLPVQTLQDAQTTINKIIAHEQGSSSYSKTFFFSDSATTFDFKAGSEQLRAILPDNVKSETLSRDDNTFEKVHQYIIASFNEGPMIVNFFGHGAIEQWADNGLLTSNDVQALNNGSRLPLVVMMTCANGSFVEKNTNSIAEMFLKTPNGGAVATLSASEATEPVLQMKLNLRFYQILFGNRDMRLGDVVRNAKADDTVHMIRRTWTFFGDPTMRLR